MVIIAAAPVTNASILTDFEHLYINLIVLAFVIPLCSIMDLALPGLSGSCDNRMFCVAQSVKVISVGRAVKSYLLTTCAIPVFRVSVHFGDLH